MKKIPLTKGLHALVDNDDFEILRTFRWKVVNATKKGHPSLLYAFTVIGKSPKNKNGKTIYMHRLIMNTPKRMMTDHINHDTLDNRKANLRIVTNAQNQWNKKVQSNNKSGAKGVFWNGKNKKFSVRIGFLGETIRLLQTEDFLVATRAYNKAAKKLYGEFALLNK